MAFDHEQVLQSPIFSYDDTSDELDLQLLKLETVPSLPNNDFQGGLASGIPGEVRGHWTAHQMYGKLPWKDLFTPTIKILRSGITVAYHLG